MKYYNLEDIYKKLLRFLFEIEKNKINLDNLKNYINEIKPMLSCLNSFITYDLNKLIYSIDRKDFFSVYNYLKEILNYNIFK